MKKRMREQLIKPQYNVQDFYHTNGIAQAIATNMIFDNFTMFVILVNALWISVDADLNDAETLLDASLVFQLAENFFCIFFTFEVSMRFLAFNGKRHCLKDAWFVFDSILVTIMIIETWLIPVSILVSQSDSSSGLGNASILRMFRMVRLIRISRMVRLLKAIPELVILVKGIRAATRSVSVFFLLWLIIIYVFAIVFKQLTVGDPVGEEYFNSVPEAMHTLFLDGILPDASPLVNSIVRENLILYPVIMFFIMLASITVMYMLVGVLVDVVGAIASAEKEGMTVAGIAQDMRYAFGELNHDTDLNITQYELKKLLAEPQIVEIITDAEVDIVAFIDTTEMVFEEPEIAASGIPFEKFIEIVLNLRGSSLATVKDIKESIRCLKKIITSGNTGVLTSVREQFEHMNDHMNDIADANHDGEYDD